MYLKTFFGVLILAVCTAVIFSMYFDSSETKLNGERLDRNTSGWMQSKNEKYNPTYNASNNNMHSKNDEGTLSSTNNRQDESVNTPSILDLAINSLKENTNEYYQSWNKEVCDIQAKEGGDIGAVRNILYCEMGYRVKFRMLLAEVSALEQENKNSFNGSQKLSVDVIKDKINNALNLLDQKIESGKSTIDFMINTAQ